MVVLLHVSVPVVQDWRPDIHWLAAAAYKGAGAIAVPLFFMVSGMFVLQSPAQVPRRFLSIAIALILWSFVYYLWQTGGPFSLEWIAEGLNRMALGPVVYHLWFLYVLLILYLASPLLRRFAYLLERRGWMIFTVLWFSALTGCMVWRAQGIPLHGPESGIILAFSPGYFLLGYWLRDKKFATPRRKLSLLAIVFLAALGCTYAASLHFHQAVNFFFAYYNLPVLAMAVIVFLLIKSTESWEENNRVVGWITMLTPLTFGVYCLHVLVLEAMMHYAHLTPADFNSILWLPLYALLIFGLSALAVALFRTIAVRS